MKPVNPDDPAVGEVIAEWRKQPGAVGVRIMMPADAGRDPTDPGIDRIALVQVSDSFGEDAVQGALAGSVLTLDRAIRNMRQFLGLRPEQALGMATRNTAELLGISLRGLYYKLKELQQAGVLPTPENGNGTQRNHCIRG